ncbi:hypothetical protein B0A53_06177 [Rhodotorula sp. CCFEE 5036]|jgi:hypothetical protein|nr:hypothetical protein B0A53_06177 [Rhodotorula sp. CCFEE 5036]
MSNSPSMSAHAAANLIDFDDVPEHPHPDRQAIGASLAAPPLAVNNFPVPTSEPVPLPNAGLGQPVNSTIPLPTQRTSPFAPLPSRHSQPAAPSVSLSIASLQRREDATAWFQLDSARRRQQLLDDFEDKERRRWETESAGLRAKDAESRLGDGAKWEEGDAQADDEVGQDMARQIRNLQEQLEEHRRALDFQQRISRDLPARPALATSPKPVALPVVFNDLGSRHKPKPPSAWTGVYDYRKRETWLASAEAWLASLGLKPNDPVDRLHTPSAYYAIRGLLSDVEPTGGISPQAWFDARERHRPIASAADFVAAIREHWVDDQAAQRSFDRYRLAKQNNQTTRDFATQVAALADAVLTHSVPDADRIGVFLGGLRSNVASFVRNNIAMLAVQGITTPSFEQVVRVAVVADTIPEYQSRSSTSTSTRSSAPAPATSASSSSRRNGVDNARSSERSDSSSTAANLDAWRERAAKWQAEHPTSKRADWHKPDANPARNPLLCYNCGKKGTHISTACPHARVTPSAVVAAVSLPSGKSAASLAKASPAGPEAAKGETMTVASATITGLSSKESEKASDE